MSAATPATSAAAKDVPKFASSRTASTGPRLSLSRLRHTACEIVFGELKKPVPSVRMSAATVTLPVMEPGSLYGDRLRRVDLRLSKSITFGRTRIAPSLDIFNLLNASGVSGYNTRYGPQWLYATDIQDPRIFRVAAQVDF